MKPNKRSLMIRWLLFGYFFLPLVFFVIYFRLQLHFEYVEFFQALGQSIFQSSIASFFSILGGTVLSQGLMHLSKQRIEKLQYALLVPQILPVFFTALILFSILQPFPLGFWGIVIIFTFINLGLATVLVYQAQVETLGAQSLVAEVLGVSRYRFYTKIWWPALRSSLINYALVIFVICFTSFSVPIIAGNGRHLNLELLIYEKIFIESNWPLATTYCLLQMGLIYALTKLMGLFKPHSQKRTYFLPSAYIICKPVLILVFSYLFIYCYGYAAGLLNSLSQIDFILKYQSSLLDALFFSVKALFLFLVFMFILLLAWIYDFIHFKRHHPLLNFVSLSTLVVGFSFYLVFSFNPKTEIFKLAVATSLLFFIPLMKLFLEEPLNQLKNQIQIARLYHIPTDRIILEIIMAQLSKPISLWCSAVSLWFLCDYAISKAVGLQSVSLGTLAASFLTSYRLDLAYLMTFIIFLTHLFIMSVIYFVIQGAYVVYKKVRL